MFQVYVSKSFAFLFPPSDLPLGSPFLYGGAWYWRLDGRFFAWASRVIPRAIASGACAPHFADVLEDMRQHLARTAPASLTESASLLAAGPVPSPSSAEAEADLALFVATGECRPWEGYAATKKS